MHTLGIAVAAIIAFPGVMLRLGVTVPVPQLECLFAAPVIVMPVIVVMVRSVRGYRQTDKQCTDRNARRCIALAVMTAAVAVARAVDGMIKPIPRLYRDALV